MWRFYTEQGAASAYGTALPGSPTDGQEYTLVDSTTNPTYQWRFRYNAGSSNTDKWEFVGGASGVNETPGNDTTTSVSYVDANGPTFTVPRGGVYIIELVIGSTVNTITAAGGSTRAAAVKLGAAAAADTEAAFSGDDSTTSGTKGTAWSGRRTLAASDLLKVQYKTSTGTGNWVRRTLKVTPVRVS